MLSVVVLAAAVLVGLFVYDRDAFGALVFKQQSAVSGQAATNLNDAAADVSFLTLLPPTDDTAEGAYRLQLGDTVEISAIEIFDAADGETLLFDSAAHPGFAKPQYVVGAGNVIAAFDKTPIGRADGSVLAVSCSPDNAFGPSGFHPWHVPPLQNLLIYFRPRVVAKAAGPSS
jgi:hypothetical protein